MDHETPEERAHRSSARRGWIAGITQVPPAGVDSRFPSWPRFLFGTLATIAIALVLLLVLLPFID